MTRIRIEPQPPSQEDIVKLSGSKYGWMECTDYGEPGTFRPVGPVWAVRQFMNGSLRLHAPYQPGDRLPVRERWADIPAHDGSMVAIYPDTPEEEIDEIIKDGWEFMGEWNEAETMPTKFVRRWEVVASVGVEQVNGEWFWCFSTTKEGGVKR